MNIYDNTIKTGNEILDTLIAERSLYCRENSITLTVMADASGMDFINKADMCALFGNIIENAIEAADKVSDPEKRTVSLNIRHVAGQISICEENYFNEELIIENGMPVCRQKGGLRRRICGKQGNVSRDTFYKKVMEKKGVSEIKIWSY